MQGYLDEAQELEFPTVSFREAGRQMSYYTQAMENLSEVVTRADKSLQRLREEVTVPGIYKPHWAGVGPMDSPVHSYKSNRAKLKKQKRKRGGPR